MTGRTETDVHSPGALRARRALTARRQALGLRSMQLFSQVIACGGLYLLPRAVSASWLAALCCLPVLWLIYFLSRKAEKRGLSNRAGALLVLPLLLDMQLTLIILCELVSSYVLPGASRSVVAAVTGLFCWLSSRLSGPGALPRLSHLMRYLLAAAFLYGIVSSLPFADGSNLFPLMGQSFLTTGKTALWMTGCCWRAALPVGEKGEARGDFMRVGAGLILGSVMLLGYALLQPPYGLARSAGAAARLLMLLEFSPSALSWSLILMGLMLMLALSLTGSAQQGEEVLRAAFPKSRVPSLMLMLLVIPCAALWRGEIQSFLLVALPLRTIPVLVMLAIAFLPKKEKTA